MKKKNKKVKPVPLWKKVLGFLTGVGFALFILWAFCEYLIYKEEKAKLDESYKQGDKLNKQLY